jgi:hypothetical protein
MMEKLLRIDSLSAGIGRIPLRFEPQRERPCLAQTADNPSRFILSNLELSPFDRNAVRLPSEWVAAFNRNRCPHSVGIWRLL